MLNLVEKFTPEAVEATDEDGVVAIEYVVDRRRRRRRRRRALWTGAFGGRWPTKLDDAHRRHLSHVSIGRGGRRNLPPSLASDSHHEPLTPTPQRDDRGVVALEFVLVMPFLLMLDRGHHRRSAASSARRPRRRSALVTALAPLALKPGVDSERRSEHRRRHHRRPRRHRVPGAHRPGVPDGHSVAGHRQGIDDLHRHRPVRRHVDEHRRHRERRPCDAALTHDVTTPASPRSSSSSAHGAPARSAWHRRRRRPRVAVTRVGPEQRRRRGARHGQGLCRARRASRRPATTATSGPIQRSATASRRPRRPGRATQAS